MSYINEIQWANDGVQAPDGPTSIAAPLLVTAELKVCAPYLLLLVLQYWLSSDLYKISKRNLEFISNNSPIVKFDCNMWNLQTVFEYVCDSSSSVAVVKEQTNFACRRTFCYV